MEKALKTGQTAATGSLQLFVGRVISTLFLAAGTIMLGSIIAESDYGLFVIAMIPSATLLLFHDWGVGPALTRYCAQHRAANQMHSLRKVIATGLTFEVATGLVLTIASLATANIFASTIFEQPQSAFLITIASVNIFSTSIFNGTRSVIQGFEKMHFISYLMICQAIIQGVSAPLLVLLGFGAMGALLGYTLASVTACSISIIFLYYGIIRELPRGESQETWGPILGSLLKYGTPLALATIVAGLLTQFYSFMMASYISDLSIIGNYRVAMNFAVLLTFLTTPISTVLFPAFSKINPIKETSTMKAIFSSSAKYAAFLLVPATIALMVLSEPLIATLYGSKWLHAPPFLALSIVGNLLVLFGNLSISALLQAVGETKLLLKLNLLSLAIGIPFAFLFIPSIGINGVIIGSIISLVPNTLIGVYLVRKRYDIKVDFKSSAKIMFAATIAGVVVLLFLIVFDFSAWMKLGGGFLLFLLTFLVSSPLVGAVSRADINNLRVLFSNLGPASKIVGISLVIMEKALSARKMSQSSI